MKKIKNLALLSIFLGFAASIAACVVNSGTDQAELSGKTLSMMTWNIHNLFDGEDNGFEYDEFLVLSGKWSEEKYLGRVNSITDAINEVRPLPDIVMFQEIESLKIIEDIARATQGNYSWGSFSSNPGSALGIGIMSRFPIIESKSHSITIGSDTAPRPVLEVRIQTGEEEFVIFVCHWKSKLGGVDATENVRRASARVILRRIRELRNEEPDTGIIIAGDLNENHDEFYKRDMSVICALMPDDAYSEILTGYADSQSDFIILSKNMPPAAENFPEDSIVFFSPWMRGLENGTYFYKDDWETIDHFLISAQFFKNSGWIYEKTSVVNYPPFSSANGTPLAYNARTGTGLSDHFPLVLTLKWE